MLLERAVLTIATTQRLYLNMALNLARSFLNWNSMENDRFVLATDLSVSLPSDLAHVSVVQLKPGEFGAGFSPKLYLDKLAPAKQTVFIDADCLCVRNIQFIFDRFRGRPVSVVGGEITNGEWFGDVRSVLDRLSLRALPKFNGGIYYLEPGEVASRVYGKARDLEKEYDELGLVRLRGKPNDELLMAIAMALNGLKAVRDDGSFISSPFECPGRINIDVMAGKSMLINPAYPDARHRSWYPFQIVSPALVHCLGDFHRHWLYRREQMRLRFSRSGTVTRAMARFVSVVMIEWPGRFVVAMKKMLRPIYRRLFGVRKVARSERVIE